MKRHMLIDETLPIIKQIETPKKGEPKEQNLYPCPRRQMNHLRR